MKVNFKIRFKNKVFLLSLISTSVLLVYQVLGLFGIAPTVSKDELLNTAGTLFTLLATLGVIVDPTTAGASDSERVLNENAERGENGGSRQ